METTHLMGNQAVTDLEAAERWYATLLGHAPDARPMEGLLEWHLADGFGLQVFHDPARAGGAGVVIRVADLDGAAAALAAAGVTHAGVEGATHQRILRLADPDGNLVVLTD